MISNVRNVITPACAEVKTSIKQVLNSTRMSEEMSKVAAVVALLNAVYP
jgi:hypothetical protein